MCNNMTNFYLCLVVYLLYQAAYYTLGYNHPVTYVMAGIFFLGIFLLWKGFDSAERKETAIDFIKILLCFALFDALLQLLLYLEPFIRSV